LNLIRIIKEPSPFLLPMSIFSSDKHYDLSNELSYATYNSDYLLDVEICSIFFHIYRTKSQSMSSKKKIVIKAQSIIHLKKSCKITIKSIKEPSNPCNNLCQFSPLISNMSYLMSMFSSDKEYELSLRCFYHKIPILKGGLELQEVERCSIQWRM